VQRGSLTAERQKAQARAALKESPLVARQTVLAQVIPAFCTARALVGDVLPIGLNERERFLRFPRPVCRIEATSRWARAGSGFGVASEDVAEGVWGER
jgi:hypothetical protein